MSTIKGIFEPFYPYVTGQLKLRKQILSNSTGVTIPSNITGTGQSETLIVPQLNASAGRHPNFHKYITERQCTIRMASGIDIRSQNNILEYGEGFQGSDLAKIWVLEGGITSDGVPRSGLFDNNLSDTLKAYGDPTLRADDKEGYGIVPMPGIIDATIDTKSEDGSLRDATVNWVCHNRRQLEVLEALYMRPGYPILLEWGWVPFIDNTGEINENGYSVLPKFFDSNSNFEELNLDIRERKIESCGNYDGFIGYCKNFMFKAREDGGFDCTTEIIAQGEILESLKSTVKMVPKMLGLTNFEFVNHIDMFFKMTGYSDTNSDEKRRIDKLEIAKVIDGDIEPIDNFLYYLRSIKANLDKAGDKAALTYAGTSNQKWFGGKWGHTEGGFQEDNPNGEEWWAFPVRYGPGLDSELGQMLLGALDKDNPNRATELREEKAMPQNQPGADRSKDMGYSRSSFYYFTDDQGNYVPVTRLNEFDDAYVDGYEAIKSLIRDVAKTSKSRLKRQEEGWEDILKGLKQQGAFFKKGEGVAEGGAAATYDSRSYPDEVEWDNLGIRALEGIGIDSIMDGTIIKEFSVEDETATDSGIRKKIFVRWDLICQILNHLVTQQYKEDHAVVELTYLTKNTPTYRKGGKGSNKKFEKDKYGNKVKGYYIPYAPPKESTVFPIDVTGLENQYESIVNPKRGKIMENFKLDVTSNYHGIPIQSKDAFLESNALQNLPTGGTFDYEASGVKYPPILGRSFDRNICLMPHQIPNMVPRKVYTTGETFDSTPDERAKAEIEDLKAKKNLTSFKDVSAELHSIGHVMFNLDYLIQTYEELVLEEYATTNSLGEEMTQRRLKKKFSFHDWVTKIWNGVNDACAGYYDFGLHVEHERPNVARVIDFTMSGGTKDLPANAEIFEFNPQGLNSITRDFFFQSKLDNDFASTISIAAQAPNELQSLEAVSFKAFHKGIKNRFTSNTQDFRDYTAEAAASQYKKDYKQYENTLKSLLVYIDRQNNSNYESELMFKDLPSEYIKKPISPETAKSMAKGLEELRVSLENREPEFLNNGDKNPNIGQWKDGVSNSRNAIIPLTINMTLDGIAGMHPLNIFKINKEKLPKGYDDPKIIFVMKSETHKISPGQDWTVDVSGYLSLLDDNPPSGTNATIEINDIISDKANQIDKAVPIGLINPTYNIQTGKDVGTDGTFSYVKANGKTKQSPYAYLVSGKDWPFRNGRSDFSKNENSHLGLDIILPHGTPLYAMGDGTVTAAIQGGGSFNQGIPEKRGQGWGAYLKLTLSDAETITEGGKTVKKILYAHLSKIVKTGTVKKGDLIALSGGLHKSNGSGNSQAPHLHIECGPNKYLGSGFSTPSPEGTIYNGKEVNHLKHHNRFVNGYVYDPKLILNYEGSRAFGSRIDEYDDVT